MSKHLYKPKVLKLARTLSWIISITFLNRRNPGDWNPGSQDNTRRCLRLGHSSRWCSSIGHFCEKQQQHQEQQQQQSSLQRQPQSSCPPTRSKEKAFLWDNSIKHPSNSDLMAISSSHQKKKKKKKGKGERKKVENNSIKVAPVANYSDFEASDRTVFYRTAKQPNNRWFRP